MNPVTFQVDPQEDFIDLTESYFEVEVVAKKSSGTNLSAGDIMALANNLAHSIFKQINVRLNGTLISPQTDTYHYKAFIIAALNHDRDDGKTILVPEGWYNSLDVPDDGDADEYTANMLNPAHADYAALSDEKKALVNSRVQFFDVMRVTLKLRPYLEVFHLSKLLIPGVQIQIDIYFNAHSCVDHSEARGRHPETERTEVNVKPILAQVRVAPSIYQEIISDRKSRKVVTYPTARGEIRTYSLPRDNRHFECSNSFLNQLPNCLLGFLIEQAAFNADIT